MVGTGDGVGAAVGGGGGVTLSEPPRMPVPKRIASTIAMSATTPPITNQSALLFFGGPP